MTKVCTQAGLRSSDRRLFRPDKKPEMVDWLGDGLRPGEVDGLRGGVGKRDFDRDLRLPRPISNSYGETLDFLRPCFLARFSFSSSSISTSCISAETPSSGLMAMPSRRRRAPKIRKRPAARKFVMRFGMRVGTAWPRTADKTVMVISALKAAENTTRRSCFIAMSAATRNVLSPTSEKRIMVRERTKEWKGRIMPSCSSATGVLPGLVPLVTSRWSLFAESGRGGDLSCVLPGRSSGFYEPTMLASFYHDGVDLIGPGAYIKSCHFFHRLGIRLALLFGLILLGVLVTADDLVLLAMR